MSVRIDTTRLDSRLFQNAFRLARTLAERKEKVTLVVLSKDRDRFPFTIEERAFIDVEECGPGVIR